MVGLEWALDDASYLNMVLFPSSLPLSLHWTLALDMCMYGLSIACNIKMPYALISLEKLRLSYLLVSKSFLEFCFSNTTLDNRNYSLTILGKDLNSFKVRAKIVGNKHTVSQCCVEFYNIISYLPTH